MLGERRQQKKLRLSHRLFQVRFTSNEEPCGFESFICLLGTILVSVFRKGDDKNEVSFHLVLSIKKPYSKDLTPQVKSVSRMEVQDY